MNSARASSPWSSSQSAYTSRGASSPGASRPASNRACSSAGRTARFREGFLDMSLQLPPFRLTFPHPTGSPESTLAEGVCGGASGLSGRLGWGAAYGLGGGEEGLTQSRRGAEAEAEARRGQEEGLALLALALPFSSSASAALRLCVRPLFG